MEARNRKTTSKNIWDMYFHYYHSMCGDGRRGFPDYFHSRGSREASNSNQQTCVLSVFTISLRGRETLNSHRQTYVLYIFTIITWIGGVHVRDIWSDSYIPYFHSWSIWVKINKSQAVLTMQITRCHRSYLENPYGVYC